MENIFGKKYKFIYDDSIFFTPLGIGEYLGTLLFNIKWIIMEPGGKINYNSDLNPIIKFILYTFNVITWQYWSNGKEEGIRWIYSWTIPWLNWTITTPSRYEIFVPENDWSILDGIGHWLFFSYHFKLVYQK